MIDQVLLTRPFTNEFIEAFNDMRKKQKLFFEVKKKRLKPNDPIFIKALHEAIAAEKKADDLIESITVKKKVGTYDLFVED